MKVIRQAELREFFDGSYPMFVGQGEMTQAERERESFLYGKYLVTFHLDESYWTGWMYRAFNSKQEILDYMKRWGLGADDIDRIDDHSPYCFRESWVVQAHDPFYGTSGKGHLKRWRFDTKQEADKFADNLEAPWYLDNVIMTIIPTFNTR